MTITPLEVFADITYRLASRSRECIALPSGGGGTVCFVCPEVRLGSFASLLMRPHLVGLSPKNRNHQDAARVLPRAKSGRVRRQLPTRRPRELHRRLAQSPEKRQARRLTAPSGLQSQRENRSDLAPVEGCLLQPLVAVFLYSSASRPQRRRDLLRPSVEPISRLNE